MKHIVRRHKSFIFSLSLLAFVVVAGVVLVEFRKASVVSAGPSHNFTGFAWSDMPNGSDECIVGGPGVPGCMGNGTNLLSGRGAGWISFNNNDIGSSVDYGVNVDTDGNITGNAWSEHMGWITFNITGGCPGGTCSPQINLTTGAFSGWARAVAGGTPQSGGWDGWISLSNNGLGGPAYGVTVSPTTGTGIVSGYAWGSDVLGWIKFDGVQINFDLLPVSPALTLVANPLTIVACPGNPLVTDLTYASPDDSPFSSCTFTSAPSSSISGAIAPDDYPIPEPANYTIAGVSVVAPSTTYTLSCTNDTTLNATASATVTVAPCPPPPSPTATLSGPTCVQTATTLTWTSNNVDTCTINQGVGTVTPTSGGTYNDAVSSTTTYTLTCSGPSGSVSPSPTYMVTVDPTCTDPIDPATGGPITPIFKEV